MPCALNIELMGVVMTGIWRSIPKLAVGMLAAAVCAFPQSTISARPGTLNYVEGTAYVDSQRVDARQLGHLSLEQDQTLRTEDNSKAEMLLTPGVFLRIAGNSEVRMVTPSLTDTRVAVIHGEALVEVAQLYKDNHIQILLNGSSTELRKDGLYRFNADLNQIAVLDGKATVMDGDRHVDLKKGRLVSLDASKLRAEKFDTKQTNDLYAWSNLRSEYGAEASYSMARNITVNDIGGGWGNSWYGTGWYWNPWYSSWAFIPANYYGFSPFGWGFYSPGYIGYAPLYYFPARSRPVAVNPRNVPSVPLTPGVRPGQNAGSTRPWPRRPMPLPSTGATPGARPNGFSRESTPGSRPMPGPRPALQAPRMTAPRPMVAPRPSAAPRMSAPHMSAPQMAPRAPMAARPSGR